MGYPADHKEKTRQRIIHSARKLWKTKGYGGASVDAVMKDADLTRGGFYAHFKSKDDLLVTALHENKMLDGLKKLREKGIVDPLEQQKAILDWYLGVYHRDHPENGCPLTALTQETPRLNEKPRKVISAAIRRFGKWLSGEDNNKNGLAVVSMMIGAVTLSRAVGEGDLSNRILIEAKEEAEKILGL